MRYLVKMKPLEPFAFGSDQSFNYEGISGSKKSSYIIRTREFPEQTTVFGMIRYMILKERKLVKTDFQYSKEEKDKMYQSIGKESFRFLVDEKQDFGELHSISPVFLMNQEGQHIIRNPFHNTDLKQYRAMKMQDEKQLTSKGYISFPQEKEFDAKRGHAGGYLNVDTKEICPPLFESLFTVGNRKNGYEETKEDGFFKRELKILDKDYCFAVYVEAEQLPKQEICYMGQKKAAFLFTAEQSDVCLVEHVKAQFSDEGVKWYLALSDILVSGPLELDEFSIIEKKKVKNLETILDEKTQTKRFRKSNKEFSLIESGSVFYDHCNLDIKNENCEQIGYNKIVQIGGC